MKVLFIGSERSDAQAVATSLRGLDQAVSVSWAGRVDHARTWLDENRDLAAIVVDEQTNGERFPFLIKHIQALGLRPAVVVIVADGTSTESLPAGADQAIRRNQTLYRDLPVVVTRALERVARLDLERKLDDAARLATEQQSRYDAEVARVDAAWEMADEQMRTAALQVQRAREKEEAVAADVARLSQRESELSTQLAEATARTVNLEQRLADAKSSAEAADAAREEADEWHSLAANDIATLQDREIELTRLLDEATAHRRDLEARLAATETAIAAPRDGAPLTRREAHLVAQVTKLKAVRDTLTGQLEEASITVRTAVACERDLATRLQQERASRETLEHRLAATLAAHQEAKDSYESALASASDVIREAASSGAELAERLEQEYTMRASLDTKLAEQQRLFEAQLADAQLERDADRVTQAHRMETASPLASDIAARCTTLLGSIRQQGREWLARASDEAESRRQGEHLFDELDRVVRLLQDLAACGEDEATKSLTADVETERIERLPLFGEQDKQPSRVLATRGGGRARQAFRWFQT